jgi:hypothetical protein
MGNSENNEYSQEFVDGVISDYMARKKKNTNIPAEDTADDNQRIIGYKVKSAENPNATTANNSQGLTGQDVISESGPGADYRQIQWSPINIENRSEDTAKDNRRLRINLESPELGTYYNQTDRRPALKRNSPIREDEMSALSADAPVNPRIRNDYNSGAPANNNQRIVRILLDNPNIVSANYNPKTATQDALIGNTQNVIPVNLNTMTSPEGNSPILEDEISALSADAPVNPGIKNNINSGTPINKSQRVAGQEVILDKDSERKQRTLQINNNQNPGNSPSDEDKPDIFGKTGKDYGRLWRQINYGDNGMVKNMRDYEKMAPYLEPAYNIAMSPEYYKYLKKKISGR